MCRKGHKMGILTWFNTRRLHKFYHRQDVRVIKDTLSMWDANEHKWVPLLSKLPYSFGKVTVTIVAMTPDKDLLYTLLFREKPMDFFAPTKIHPVLVFCNHPKGLWREDYHSLDELKDRIGYINYQVLIEKAAVDWSHCIVV